MTYAQSSVSNVALNPDTESNVLLKEICFIVGAHQIWWALVHS